MPGENQFYADNEKSSEGNEKTIDLSRAYTLKFEPTPESAWTDQSVVFFCNDCGKLVATEKDPHAIKFSCTECKGRNISFGTERSVNNFFKLNDGGKRKK